MIVVLILSSIISTIIFSNLSFKEDLVDLTMSYKKTLSFQHMKDGNSNSISESLNQMKIICVFFIRTLFIALPFILIAIYLLIEERSLSSVFLSLVNTSVILVTFLITLLMLKNGKK